MMLTTTDAQVTIDSISHEGRGIAHINGKAVFVDGALPGERVAFRYTKRRGRYDEGTISSVLQCAPERVEPRCSHYGICGGCSLQHLAAESQIAHKAKVLAEQLQHQAQAIPDTSLPSIVGPLWGYRHKARLSVRYVEKKGRVLLGFMEKRGRLVADIRRCEILHPSVGTHLEAIRAFIQSLSVYRQIPQVEIAVGEKETALVLRHLVALTEQDLALCQAFAEAQQLSLYGQIGGPDTVMRLWPKSDQDLYYRISDHDLSLMFQPLDFTQVNPDINRQLINLVLTLLDPQGDEPILDLFCGLGNFTLPLAKHALYVRGIEGDPGLVSRARMNASRNGIENAEFMALNLSEPHPALRGAYRKVLVDPPRTGALVALQNLDYATVQRLVYVSCNPATLARDAQLLVHEKGFRLSHAGVLDMFPHTSHVESIALFQRR